MRVPGAESGWGYVLLVGGALIVWSLALDASLGSERRIAVWWVRSVRRLGAWAGPVSFLRSTVLLALYAIVAWLGDLLAGRLGDPLWALVVSGPAMVAYAPVVLAMTPFDVVDVQLWRSQLSAVGAEAREQRAVAWWAGLPALAGFMAIMLTLMSIFVD
ncbi:hypothetical protein F4692_003441 [Nocardioides cavernae]|uniref:Uncharacterized protein n=1 Tax=Nocardioides cavernae TaxID=1921566 RepID=A0A7Y9KUX3_9ACTN|nr:hypothetical protein [Nocardioides cavernae]NYE38293.1 hypothetical protein [Nocardioides cavernae]